MVMVVVVFDLIWLIGLTFHWWDRWVGIDSSAVEFDSCWGGGLEDLLVHSHHHLPTTTTYLPVPVLNCLCTFAFLHYYPTSYLCPQMSYSVIVHTHDITVCIILPVPSTTTVCFLFLAFPLCVSIVLKVPRRFVLTSVAVVLVAVSLRLP